MQDLKGHPVSVRSPANPVTAPLTHLSSEVVPSGCRACCGRKWRLKPRADSLISARALEAVINFRAVGVARVNRARRDGARRLWWFQNRGRQRSLARFTPQPRGLGQIFLISSSLVASRHPVSTPRTKTSPWGPRYASLLTPRTEENLAPSAGRGKVNNSL